MEEGGRGRIRREAVEETVKQPAKVSFEIQWEILMFWVDPCVSCLQNNVN